MSTLAPVQRTRRAPRHRLAGGRKSAVVLLLACCLLVGGLEVHPAQAEPLSEVAAARGGAVRVDTSSHPERAADCVETEHDVSTRPCAGCLSSLSHSSLEAGLATGGRPPDASRLRAAASSPAPRAFPGRSPASRGPPAQV